MRTKSLRIASSVNCSMMRVPVGPPATPVAITGIFKVFRARATFTPLPPAMAVCSTARWRRPRRKFGTASVLSIAALSVTVMIMWRTTPRTSPQRPYPQRHQRQRAGQHEQGYCDERSAERRRRLAHETCLLDRLGRHERHGAHHAAAHEHLDRPDPLARAQRPLDLLRGDHVLAQRAAAA